VLVAIIGLGLIGGSIGLALRQGKKSGWEIVGYSRRQEAVANALSNSATTMRFLGGLLVSQPFLSVITGDASLRNRPMGRLIVPLKLMGAEIWGRRQDSFAHLVVTDGSQFGEPEKFNFLAAFEQPLNSPQLSRPGRHQPSSLLSGFRSYSP
jgi:hypothetical protein